MLLPHRGTIDVVVAFVALAVLLVLPSSSNAAELAATKRDATHLRGLKAVQNELREEEEHIDRIEDVQREVGAGDVLSGRGLEEVQEAFRKETAMLDGREGEGEENRDLLLDPRIIGGVNSRYDRNWFVMIGNNPGCVGTLIAGDFVMTTATCAATLSPTNVVLMPYDNNFKQSSGVQEIVTHPCYEADWFLFDISLIRIGTVPSTGTPSYQPVTLTIQRPRNGNFLRILGFGATSEGDKTTAAVTLKEATLSMERRCYRPERNPAGWPNYNELSHLCANAPNSTAVGPCDGDSGSPIGIVDLADTPRFEQVGILTGFYPNPGSTVQCGNTDNYFVYTRVETVYNWIRTNVCSKSFAKPMYFNCDEFMSNGDALGRQDDGTGFCRPEQTGGGCAPRQWLEQAATQVGSLVAAGTQQVYRYFGGDSP